MTIVRAMLRLDIPPEPLAEQSGFVTIIIIGVAVLLAVAVTWYLIRRKRR